MYQKFQTELKDLKHKEDTKARAQRVFAFLQRSWRLESNLLKVFDLQFQRGAFAVFRLVGFMPLEAINQAIRCLCGNKPLADARRKNAPPTARQ
jgi:hypothetical protein